MVNGNGHSKLAQLLIRYRSDEKRLKRELFEHYPPAKLADLLSASDGLTRTSAGYSLGLIGTQSSVVDLLEALKHQDSLTRLQAEKSIWSIWFRSNDPDHDQMIMAGAKHIEQQELDQALEVLTTLIEISPEFAEAYNQRAIVHFLQGEWELSIQDCLQAVDLNPYHFGAYTGMGHCYWELERLKAAHVAYRKALIINPTLYVVAQAIRQIEAQLAEHDDNP